MLKNKTNNSLKLVTYSLTRHKLIDFIKRKDIFYKWTNFEGHSDDQLRNIYLRIEEEIKEKKKSVDAIK